MLAHASAEAEEGEQPMRGADDWWALILGTGFRGTLDVLTASDRAHVERRVRASLADRVAVNTPLVLATARKPPLGSAQ